MIQEDSGSRLKPLLQNEAPDAKGQKVTLGVRSAAIGPQAYVAPLSGQDRLLRIFSIRIMGLPPGRRVLAQILQSTGPQASYTSIRAAVSSTHPSGELHMKKIQQGFTLIELMIVVAIIGILAAIAIPAYQDYTIRAQVTEGLNLASDLKAGVGEFFANEGAWPVDQTDLGIDEIKSGKYVSDVSVSNGTIVITFGGAANDNLISSGDTLSIRPMVSANGDVVWLCGYNTGADANPALEDPTSGASDADSTDVLEKYLPQSCRSDA
jgi:type IV pilus assembly protein PilA